MEEMTLEEYRAQFVKPQRAAYQAREADEQQALFEWIATVTPREPRLAWCFHTPNGEKRDIGTAVKLQKMGLKPGIPDLLLPVPSRGYVGCAIDLKIKGGRATPEQEAWFKHLGVAGWLVGVEFGWIDAARSLCWYLEREPGDMGLEATI